MSQQIISYLYHNNILAEISDDVIGITRDRTVYAKNIRVYQGVSNTLRIVFRNADQKPVSVDQQSPIFRIIRDSDATTFLEKPITILNPSQGTGTVTITDGDLLDLIPGYYYYSITTQDEFSREIPAYVDDNYGARGNLEVVSGTYPVFAESQQALLISGLDVTSSLNARASQNSNSALHTAELYFDNFTGSVTVQASQDPVPGVDPATNYFDVVTREYTNRSSPDYINFNGIFSVIRFRVVTESGDFLRALYRA